MASSTPHMPGHSFSEVTLPSHVARRPYPISSSKPAFFSVSSSLRHSFIPNHGSLPSSLAPPKFDDPSRSRFGSRPSAYSVVFPWSSVCACSNGTAQVEDQADVQVAEGYTMAQFCDKMIDVFMNEKTRTKELRKLLIFREEWKKYGDRFYHRCQARLDGEGDPVMKQKLIKLKTRIKKIDEDMDKHFDLLNEVQENPTDLNAVVARRRRDFTGDFFRFLTLLSETYDSLDDRDAISRIGAKCLSSIYAFDNALEDLEMLESAQEKFNEILNSPSLDAACDKIKGLAKAKELDSSLILLINGTWASAKDSRTIKNEVKNIMYHLYKTTKSSLKSIAPREIKLLKYLLNITDPEERFSALATAFSPGDEHEAKDESFLYTTPKELHKWIKIMLDAYHLNLEETELREAKRMTQPVVIQRLFILKETIEAEYMKQQTENEDNEVKND